MAEATRTAEIITYQAAAMLVSAAVSHAGENNWNIAVAVLDPWGAVVASGRMDGVSPIILDIANDKAFTATLGKSTSAFFDRMSSSPDLAMGVQNRPRLCTWEGGIPIRKEGVLVGAIGVSGAQGFEDAACAKHALERLNLDS